MTNRSAAEKVVKTLQQAGYETYLVGGCVRDMLLGKGESAEHDVATSARPDEVRRLFARTRLVGAAFGVLLVGIARQWIEVASFRTDETYTNGRHPDAVRFATIEDDVARRDFTVNGMYYDPFARRLIDLVGGQADLQARVIRAIGQPQKRFSEDYLRMLRAVRFSAQLGFSIEPGTAAAIADHADQVAQVSPERILEELHKLLACETRSSGIRAADELNLLGHILPEVDALHGRDGVSFAGDFNPSSEIGDAFDQTLSVLDHLGPTCRGQLGLAGLLHLSGLARAQKLQCDCSVRKRPKLNDLHWSARLADGICRHLACSNRQRREVVWLVQFLPLLGRGRSVTLAEVKRMMICEHYRDLRTLYAARVRAGLEPQMVLDAVDNLAGRIDPLTLNAPALMNGTDLQECLSLAPGPAYREMLDRIYDAQLNEQITTKDQAEALARKLLLEMDLPSGPSP